MGIKVKVFEILILDLTDLRHYQIWYCQSNRGINSIAKLNNDFGKKNYHIRLDTDPTTYCYKNPSFLIKHEFPAQKF